jgi:hypothetical protein
MDDEEKLASLIRDARLRAEERHRVAVKQFETDLVSLLKEDMLQIPWDGAKLLKLRYEWDEDHDRPVAKFRAGRQPGSAGDWLIWYGCEEEGKPEYWHLEVLPQQSHRFTNLDELALLIDKHSKYL